mmetsp:Transcript_33876/g.32321  ORF Transcript_33876/g.32321 Transcript_33876/m.32321 type:complete len:100 (-) Transcript_33876:1018-1317(-)
MNQYPNDHTFEIKYGKKILYPVFFKDVFTTAHISRARNMTAKSSNTPPPQYSINIRKRFPQQFILKKFLPCKHPQVARNCSKEPTGTNIAPQTDESIQG